MTEREDAAPITPGRRTITRRAIARGVAIALPVAAGLRLAAAQTTVTPPLDATTIAADIAAINGLLAFEHLLAAFYDAGLTAFDAAAFDAAGSDPALRPTLEQARDAEVAHAATLSGLVTSLGGTPVEADRYVWSYAAIAGFLATARTLENSATGAYAGAIPLVRSAAAVIALVGIHSVEARHAAYLADKTGVLAFTDPIDQPLSAAEVTAILSPFIAGGAPAPAETAVAAVATTVVVTPPPQPTATPTPTATSAAASAPMTPEATAAKGANKKGKKAKAEKTPTAGASKTKTKKNAATSNGGKANKKKSTPTAGQSAAQPTVAANPPSAGTSTEASFGGTPGLESVIADAAQRWGVPADQIEVVTNEAHEWSSAALGCPKPGEMYAQVITPGYVVLLQSGDHRIEYHLDTRGNFVDCKST